MLYIGEKNKGHGDDPNPYRLVYYDKELSEDDIHPPKEQHLCVTLLLNSCLFIFILYGHCTPTRHSTGNPVFEYSMSAAHVAAAVYPTLNNQPAMTTTTDSRPPSPSALPPIPSSPTFSYASTARPIPSAFNLPLPPPPHPVQSVLAKSDIEASQIAYS